MKKTILLSLLFLHSFGLLSQEKFPSHADKNTPPIDPTKIVQGLPTDTEAPVVTCLNGLNVNIMPTGMIQLWASDFLVSVLDNETPTNQIKIGIRKAGTGTGFPLDGGGNPISVLMFECNELGTKDLELWAIDYSGNASFCTATIIIQDNLGNCPGNNSVNLNLCARVLCSGAAIETAIFYIDGTSNFVPPFSYFDLTDTGGCTEISNNFPIASTFTIYPSKEDNPTNGMDEQDFVLLSKHINGTQPFTQAWQWVAADANRDGLITLEDSIEFRNLLLGIYSELPNNYSWRFVPKGYQFPSPDPLAQPLPESVTIADVLANMDTIFVGIKIGDLDCSAIPDFRSYPGDSTAERNQLPTDPTKIVQSASSDTEAPVITCLNGLSVNLMPSEMIQLWASDFLLSVSDNETPTNQIKIAVRKAGTGFGFPVDGNGDEITKLSYNCTQLGAQLIELWAMDEAGNATYCETPVTIQDALGLCAIDNDTINVCVTWGCNGMPMPGLSVQIQGVPSFFPPFQISGDSVTGIDGCAEIVLHDTNINYTIFIEKDNDPNNGLTTIDLLLIAKHILGVEPLDNPYKMIAADANKSGSITAFDIIELRKLILGIYSELPNNTSWRFVDADFEFPNPVNPFSSALPEFINIENGQAEDAAFVGIKVGDLDCSAQLEMAPPPDYPDAFLAMPDTILQAGLEYELPLFIDGNELWSGYQFKMNWDAQKLAFQSMTLHSETSVGNWNMTQATVGSLATSWIGIANLVAFGPNTPIATIRFKALQTTVSLKEEVSLSNDLLRAEGYVGQGNEKRDLLLTFLPQLKPSSSDPTADKNQLPTDPTKIVQSASSDIEAPMITCLNGLSVNIMPTGLIQLWASDFLLSLSDNETPTNEIKIAVRKAGTGFGFPQDMAGNPIQTVLFDCDELGTQGIELWARDLAGNTAHCSTYLIVVDNFGNCPPNPPFNWLIEVCAKTEQSDGIEELDFSISGVNPSGPFYANEVVGPFMNCNYFDVPLGSNVTVVPVKDDNPLNGVTTFDLVLISRHYRGIELLNSPYKIIAADANRDGLVNMEDSIEFRKLILGVYTELPNNTSWRFVDKSYTFPDPNNPFAAVFPESLSVQNIQSFVSADFVGIKVGDVNGTAIANVANPGPEERDVKPESPIIGIPYPNPTEGDLNLPINLPSSENLRLEISDISGKLVWVNDLKVEIGSYKLEIPAAAMPGKGVYVWRLRTENWMRSGKIVRM